MNLLQPFQLGNLTLKNKMVMSAMTRSRATIEGVPTEMMVEYYCQRASAGLIISEAINISPDAVGSPLTPSIYTEEQIREWRRITDAVHQAGGVIFAQLWHTGRVAHSAVRGGKLPVAPSAVKIEGMKHFTLQGMQDFETPKELTISEIKQTIADYTQAAKNAIAAGFDGVQFHAANGYLPNEFLSDSANLRTDEYGGSIENKARFVLETMTALIDAVGGEKVGIKISPLHPYAGILHNDPVATFSYLLGELNKLNFSFVELMKRSPMFALPEGYPTGDEVEIFGTMTNKTLIVGGGYTQQTAENELNKGTAKLMAFGSPFIANPDLPKRFEIGAELALPDKATMFGGNEKGYIDYPFLG